MRKSKVIVYVKPDSGIDFLAGRPIEVNLDKADKPESPTESRLEFQVEMAGQNEVMV